MASFSSLQEAVPGSIMPDEFPHPRNMQGWYPGLTPAHFEVVQGPWGFMNWTYLTDATDMVFLWFIPDWDFRAQGRVKDLRQRFLIALLNATNEGHFEPFRLTWKQVKVSYRRKDGDLYLWIEAECMN